LDGFADERMQVRDTRLWPALTGQDSEGREEAARTICALEQENIYVRELVSTIDACNPDQRAVIGEAISLLGDLRFSPPYFMSEMLPVPTESEPFALAQMAVTNAAYESFVRATRHRNPRGWRHGRPLPQLRNAPVVWVSALDADAYCHWLSAETGFSFRLPSDREWLLAACGGDQDRVYPWGNEFRDECANVWGRQASQRVGAVGLFPEGAGPYGHLDLIGNVWEWCSSPSDLSGETEKERVMVGGSWRSKPRAVTCGAARQTAPPADSYEVTGFRIARSTHV
jgi:formylglycine-generating enzyme required for sulfatase activity